MHAKLQKIQNYLALSMSSQGNEINAWSLRFKDESMEVVYRQMNTHSQLITFNFSIALMLYAMVSSMYSALRSESISKHEIIFFLASIMQSLVFLALINLKKAQAHAFFFIFQMLTSSAIAVKIYKNNFKTDSHTIQNNQSIQAITIMSILCISNLGSSIRIKISCFFLSSAAFFTALSLSQSVTPQEAVQLVLTCVLYGYTTYQQELRQRVAFLRKKRIKNYHQKISEFMPYCLISGRFNASADKIELLECNSKANKELNICNERDLEEFLGSTFLQQTAPLNNKNIVQEERLPFRSNFNGVNQTLLGNNTSQESKRNNTNRHSLSQSPCFKTRNRSISATIWKLDFEEIEQLSTIENSLKTYLLKRAKEEVASSEKGRNKPSKKQTDKEKEEEDCIFAKAFNDSNISTIKEQQPLSPFKLTSSSEGNNTAKLRLFQVDRVQNTCTKFTAKISIFKWNADACFVITINAKKYRKVVGMIGKMNSREYENTFLRPSSTAALTKMVSNEEAKGGAGERETNCNNSSKIVREGRSGSLFTWNQNNSMNANETSPNSSYFGSQSALKIKLKQASKKYELLGFHAPTESRQIITKQKQKRMHMQVSITRILSACVRGTRQKLEELLQQMTSQINGSSETKLTLNFDYLRSYILNTQLISSSMMAHLQVQDLQSRKKHKVSPFKTTSGNSKPDLEQVNVYTLKNSIKTHFAPLFAQENISFLISFDDSSEDKITTILSHRLHLQLLIANLISYALQLYNNTKESKENNLKRAQQIDDVNQEQFFPFESRFVAVGMLPGNYQQNEVLVFFLQIPDDLEDNFEYLSRTGVEGLQEQKNVNNKGGTCNQDIFSLELPKILLKNIQSKSSLCKGISSDKVAEGVKKILDKFDNKPLQLSKNCFFLDQGNTNYSNIQYLQGSCGASPSNRTAISPSYFASPTSEANQEIDSSRQNDPKQFVFQSENQNLCSLKSKTQFSRSDIEIAEERNQENTSKHNQQQPLECLSENAMIPSSACNSTNSLVREQTYSFQSVLPGVVQPNQGQKAQQQIDSSIYTGYLEKSYNSSPANSDDLMNFRVMTRAGRKTISFFLGDINSLRSKTNSSGYMDISQLQQSSLVDFTRWVDKQLEDLR